MYSRIPAAGLGLVLAAASLAPTTASARDSLPVGTLSRAPKPTRLLTWNVGTLSPFKPDGPRLPHHRELRVAGTIARLDADVVNLQELQSVAQAQRIRALLALSGRPYRLITASADDDRDDDKTSAILYRGRARKITSMVVSGRYEVKAVVLDGITVINVHTPATSHWARRTYCQALARWVRMLPGTVVAAGDFNLGAKHGAGLSVFLRRFRRYDQRTYRDMLRSFDDASEVGATTAYGLTFDHVLVRGGSIRGECVLPASQRLPQDHRPLLATIQPTRGSGPTCGPQPGMLNGLHR